MAALRFLIPFGARYGRWVLLSLPLIFATVFRFDGAARLAAGPTPAAVAAILAVVTLIAAGMAAYIARLHTGRATLTRRLQEADELHRVAARISASNTVRGAAGHVLDALRQQYPLTAAALVPAGADPARSAWRITSGSPAKGLSGPVGRSIAPVRLLPGLADDYICRELSAADLDFSAMLPGCRCSAAVPITLPDNTCTSTLVLGFDSERHLTTIDLDWLAKFAQGLAMPLERVRIQEELALMAFTDPMTGLANYRAFRRQLHEEIERAARYGHAMSLLILDVDKFKRVNDLYGHPAGDEVLRHVAKVLQEHVRAIDLPARYGGEEFAVVCPETDMDAALVLAERLRSALEASPCRLPAGELLTVTMSIGAAVFPGEAITEADLIATADAALYRAKDAGRNRVSCARWLDTCG